MMPSQGDGEGQQVGVEEVAAFLYAFMLKTRIKRVVVKRIDGGRSPIFRKSKVDENQKGIVASHEEEIAAMKEKIGGAITLEPMLGNSSSTDTIHS